MIDNSIDTIVAIATAHGNSGINVLRISGADAKDIADKIFVNKNRKKIEYKNRYMHYGFIMDDDKVVDEVLLCYMKAPNTYTAEDVVEIDCHGGALSAKKILEICLENGARLAEAGEFTKRAFLNGRIDLTQAEAVIDIINANSEKSRNVSIGQLGGRLSNKVNELIELLTDVLSNITVNIDYPEYDEDKITIDKIKSNGHIIHEELQKLIKTGDTGKIFKEGINTLIIGKPNVGKSSLMNFLLNENRAIVTEIPGTTRDTIEEKLNLNGIILNIIDTAGIRETDDVVEKIGVDKAIEKIEYADLIIFVLDASRKLEAEDLEIIKYINNKKVIYIKNKTDLQDNLSEDLINHRDILDNCINISVAKNKGLDDIIEKIEEIFLAGQVDITSDLIVNNERQLDLLRKAKDSIDEVLQAIDNDLSIDFLEIDLKDSLECLGQIVGRSVADDLTDKLFKNFCIGK